MYFYIIYYFDDEDDDYIAYIASWQQYKNELE